MHFLAARKLCRERSPNLFFASHQLDRPRRGVVYALHAVAQQLAEIMGKPQLDAGGSCGTGGCASGGCEGESIDQRRNVCLAVIDHLGQGLPTGKPELDAYLDVNPTAGALRPLWERFVNGLATELSTARFATWKRVRRTFDDSAGSLALMAMQWLAHPSHEHNVEPAFEQQARAAGIAVRLMRAVAAIGDDWRQGRLLLPLDDLVRQKIKLSEFPTYVSNQSVTNGDATSRWAALMACESIRMADLLRGAALGLASLQDDRCRRFAAAWLVFEVDAFTRLLAAGGDPFAHRAATSTWRRIRLTRRAHRLAVDPNSIESLLQTWPI